MLSRNLEKTLHRSLAYANERKHSYATLEHLLLALTEDQDAVPMLRACNVDPDRLRRDVLSYVDNELGNLTIDFDEDSKPTASFQRALQRAAIHVQSAGREEVTGANVLVAMFAERESHAVYFLQEQDMTRAAAVKYLTRGTAEQATQDTGPEDLTSTFAEAAQSLLNQNAAISANVVEQGSFVDKQKIFISYSHCDRRWISRLEVHLKPILDLGIIEYWHDGMISPGRKWREEIRESITKSQIAILLVSADFLGDFHLDKADCIYENRPVTRGRFRWPQHNSTTPPFRMTS